MDADQLRIDDGNVAVARVPVQSTLQVLVPERLVKLVDRLEPQARAEFEARLPLAAKQLFDRITEVRSFSDQEVLALLAASRADVERLEAEATRRGLLT